MPNYATPATFAAGNVLTAVQQNVLVNDCEALAKPPLAWVYSTSAQSIPNNTVTTMNVAATYQLRNATFASNTIVVGEIGFYLAVMNINWTANSTGIRIIRWNINGVSQVETHQVGNWTSQNFTCVFTANTTDVLKVEVFQTSGGALNLNAGSYMAVSMLSRL